MINFDEVLRSCLSNKWLNAIDNMSKPDVSDHVTHSTKMEDMMYKDKRVKANDSELEDIEQTGEGKLKSFKALTKDIFNSFYCIDLKFKEQDKLSFQAQKFNKTIIEKMLQDESYPVLKMLTEGKDFEAFETSKEFLKNVLNNIDELLKDISGQKNTLDVMAKKVDKVEKLSTELKELCENHKDAVDNKKDALAQNLEKKIEGVSKELSKEGKQLEALDNIVADNLRRNAGKIKGIIQSSVQKGLEKAQEIEGIISSWGTESPENMTIEAKKELVEKVNCNKRFRDMAKLIGKYREISANAIKNSVTYGRGEKFEIELGNDVNGALASEFALLGTKETLPLFFKKLSNKRLRQYRKREKVKKGNGNIVVCADESTSTKGGKDFWAKALGLSLLDVTVRNKKRFAYIHFSTETCTDEIDPSNYNIDAVMNVASLFLGGGTDFELALGEAQRLLSQDIYINADLIFITDGECDLSDSFLKTFLQFKQKVKLRVTGILLDKGEGSCSDDTIKKFCDSIYKTSELSEDDIASKVIRSIA